MQNVIQLRCISSIETRSETFTAMHLQDVIDLDTETKLKFKEILSLIILVRLKKFSCWLCDHRKPGTSDGISFDKS